MVTLQSAIAGFLDYIFTPLKNSSPFWALLAVSAATTFLFLLVFRRTTHLSRIQAAKNGMQACLLEVRLFKDAPSLILAALAGLAVNNLRYLKSSFKPLVLMLPLMALLLIHLDAWFGHLPLHSNQSAVVTVKVAPSSAAALDRVSLEVPSGVVLETPPLRITAANMVSWSVRARKTGRYPLRIQAPGLSVTKTLVISDNGWERTTPDSVTNAFWNHCLYPGEAWLPQEGPIERIQVGYSALSISLLGWETHWLVHFFLLTCGLGLVLGRLMGVPM